MEEQSKALERAAKLLLEGAVMLRESCPVCINPLYQKRDGVLYCTSCDKEVVREGDLKSREKAPSTSPIQSKIDALSLELQKAEDTDRIIELSETIKKLEKIRDS